MRSSVKRVCFLATVAALAVAAFAATAEAKVAFHETFPTLDGWVTSSHRADYGKVARSPGTNFVDAAAETGLQLTEDARFYAVSKKLPTPIENDGKDFVVSFSVKNDQILKCGGAYIKLLPELDPKDFHGDSAYWLMFGPDRCGSANRVHIIFGHKGKNLLWNKKVPAPNDRLTHVYTLRVTPANTYTYYLDGVELNTGNLDEEWDFLEPKTIPDKSDVKPEDWVNEADIPDLSDTKPDDWDDESPVIEDATATKPEDWDDKEDGEWTAPEVPNPKYKGRWMQRRIPNPAYKGQWVQKQVPNPAYEKSDTIYRIPKPLQYVGIDVWQVESGSIFNNIVIGDDVEEVLAIVKSTYGAIAEAEKAAAEMAQKKDDADATPETDILGKEDQTHEDEEDL